MVKFSKNFTKFLFDANTYQSQLKIVICCRQIQAFSINRIFSISNHGVSNSWESQT